MTAVELETDVPYRLVVNHGGCQYGSLWWRQEPVDADVMRADVRGMLRAAGVADAEVEALVSAARLERLR